MAIHPVKNISISIERTVDEVYKFTSNPANFPMWVEFIDSITKKNSIWLAGTDLGNLKIEITPQNEFGIVDHQVTLPDGTIVDNPMRVMANGEGCELIFTLFWTPGRSEEEFKQDAKAVERDLKRLKKLLEEES